MRILFCLLTVLMLSPSSAQEHIFNQLAKVTFDRLVGCATKKDSHEDPDMRMACYQEAFHSRVGPDQIKRYASILLQSRSLSSLSTCDEDTVKTVKAFEQKDYAFFRCFHYSVFRPDQIGIVFFSVEKKMPKIIKMKI